MKKEEEIFELLKTNRKLGIEELYKIYSKLVFGVIYSILKNTDETEDVLQNVFIKIFKLDNEKLPTKSHLSWLYSVAKNETINYIKKYSKEKNFENLYEISDNDTEIEKVLDKEYFNNLIKNLPQKQQEILSLKIVSNLSFKEIANILNMKIPTVQWHYYKSLNTIKLLLGNVITIFVGAFLYIKTKGLTERNEVEPEENDFVKEKNEIAIDEEKSIDESYSINQSTELKGENNRADNYTGKNDTIEITTQATGAAESSANNIISFGIIVTTILLVVIFSILLIKRQIKLKKKLSK
ncbi:sigma-70 region 2 [Clostridium sp. CAG:354]|jgi:RNA polymerase sigma-70 factor (ECF subfamily)|nr:sigma-70 family RNA polymerase sigma factor [Clostridium sp.]MBS5864427.1 sigma-70 family RNA polymerase sigma factor [Clostridium sp.]CDE11397.1 sigma-70 region 2 [Clostridium sp. CAG:354]